MTELTPQKAPSRRQWWIATAPKEQGGRLFLGPFESKSLALAVRTYVERVNHPVTYWVLPWEGDDGTA